MIITYLKKILWVLVMSFLINPSHAETKLTQAQAQVKLKQIETKINSIKTSLAKEQNKHHDLQYQIAKTVEQIKRTQTEKHNISQKALTLQTEVDKLQAKLLQSQEKIKTLQALLFQHLNLHIELAATPPLQIIFSADNPLEYYQQLELYHYLFQAEHHALKSLQQESASVKTQTLSLGAKVKILDKLKQELSAKELAYLKNKAHHAQALAQVNATINAQTSALQANQKNQIELKNLITLLLKENRLQSKRPFTVMKKRLNYPVHTSNTLAQKTQNGVIFKAPLGTQVHAVSPGRVVFADWLNGYGYLVIIDHGWGFMTLYGNNQALIKHKGDNVRQGEVIASVGESGAFHQQGLYFEIRQKAKVVSALDWFHRHA